MAEIKQQYLRSVKLRASVTGHLGLQLPLGNGDIVMLAAAVLERATNPTGLRLP